MAEEERRRMPPAGQAPVPAPPAPRVRETARRREEDESLPEDLVRLRDRLAQDGVALYIPPRLGTRPLPPIEKIRGKPLSQIIVELRRGE